MDAAGRMGRATRRAHRSCRLKRRAYVALALAALAAFVVGARETGEARATVKRVLAERAAHRDESGPPRRTPESAAARRDAARPAHASARDPAAASAEDDRPDRAPSGAAFPSSSSSPPPPAPSGPSMSSSEPSEPATLEDRIDPEAHPHARALATLMRDLAWPRGALVVVTFADAKMAALTRNWALHLRAAGRPHVVGALDAATLDAMRALNDEDDTPGGGRLLTAAYDLTLSESLDGGSSHSSGSWKRFAATRVRQTRALLEMGYDVLMSDVDVVWRRDPRPYLQCGVSGEGDDGDGAGGVGGGGGEEYLSKASDSNEALAACRLAGMDLADVAVSSDNLSPASDAREGAAYAARGVFNTGVVFVRRTPGGARFARAWEAHVRAASGRFAALTSDQQAFNAMVRERDAWPGIETDQRPVARRGGSDAESNAPSRLLVARTGFSATSDANDASEIRGTSSSSGGGSVTTEGKDAAATFALAVLPVASFQPGHVAFVQGLGRADEEDHPGAGSDEAEAEVYCAHATYTFDGSSPRAKRRRFAEAGLWDPRADRVSLAAGGIIASSKTPDSFLALDVSATFADLGDAPSLGAHLTAGARALATLRSALAFAKVTERVLVAPDMPCFCDKVWGGHDNIFNFDCHYPGSADSRHVPARRCPLDHFVNPSALEDAAKNGPLVAEAELRRLLPSGPREEEVRVVVVCGEEERGGAAATRTRPSGEENEAAGGDAIAGGLDDRLRRAEAEKKKGASIVVSGAGESAIARVLVDGDQDVRRARVVRLVLDASSMRGRALAFGGFMSEEDAGAFRAGPARALDDAPEWCSECHPRGCKNLIAPDVLAKGRTTPVREVHDQFCAAFERPEAVGVEKKAAGPKAKKAGPHEARAETAARILDDADARRRSAPNAPGRPPADDAIEAAGW